MNRILLKLTLLLCSGLYFIGCSNDFLKSNLIGSIQNQDTVYMTYLDTICPLKINIPNGENRRWIIRKYPTFLNLTMEKPQ